ncbi:MAG: gamma carbonic anhydrase family protein [Alphaproteobacteria bacterium]|nr:gamma carbonic anhydrase family protein [Alphaproteobacteria bacterium]
MALILPYKNILPKIDPGVFIAPNATVIGDVTIGAESSVWFGAVLRGDVNDITIGARTNIQDGSVIHVTYQLQGTYIGDDVTVGHMALLHACRVGNRCLIGMGSIILDGAVVEDDAMVAAGSLVTPNKVVKTGQLWGGRPARYMRDLTPQELDHLKWSANHYVGLSRAYL